MLENINAIPDRTNPTGKPVSKKRKVNKIYIIAKISIFIF